VVFTALVPLVQLRIEAILDVTPSKSLQLQAQNFSKHLKRSFRREEATEHSRPGFLPPGVTSG
jgi:hypothetical protein